MYIVHHKCVPSPQKPEEGFESPGTGVKKTRELPAVRLPGIEPGFSTKATNALNP